MPKKKFHGRWFNDRINVRYYSEIEYEPRDDHSMFIRNKYSRINNSIHDIRSKIDMVAYHTHMVEERLKLSKELMPEILSDLSDDISSKPELHFHVVSKYEATCEIYDYILAAHLEAALVQTKALLDSIAQFYSITFEREIRSFSGKGKRLINDIKNLPESLHSYTKELIDLILKSKSNWIDLAIDYRDKVVHFGSLRGFLGPRLVFDKRLKYDYKDIKNCTMPNQSKTSVYLRRLFKNQFNFCKAILNVGFRRLREIYPMSA